MRKRRVRAIFKSFCKQYKCNVYETGMYNELWETMVDNNPKRI